MNTVDVRCCRNKQLLRDGGPTVVSEKLELDRGQFVLALATTSANKFVLRFAAMVDVDFIPFGFLRATRSSLTG